MCEEARWPEAIRMIQQLNLNEAGVRGLFQQAVDWAIELTILPEDNGDR